jgi:hypothetical protein
MRSGTLRMHRGLCEAAHSGCIGAYAKRHKLVDERAPDAVSSNWDYVKWLMEKRPRIAKRRGEVPGKESAKSGRLRSSSVGSGAIPGGMSEE